jgi:hypothetical protein
VCEFPAVCMGTYSISRMAAFSFCPLDWLGSTLQRRSSRHILRALTQSTAVRDGSGSW